MDDLNKPLEQNTLGGRKLQQESFDDGATRKGKSQIYRVGHIVDPTEDENNVLLTFVGRVAAGMLAHYLQCLLSRSAFH